MDLDDALVGACSAAAALLNHAHLLNFFTSDILELDPLAAAHSFAGAGCAVVIAMCVWRRGRFSFTLMSGSLNKSLGQMPVEMSRVC